MKKFRLKFTDLAKTQLANLAQGRSKHIQYKAVGKALAFMELDLCHPGLCTHEYFELSKSIIYKVFESYAQNRTPGAYRIFWRYGAEKNQIIVLSITPHP